MNLVVRVLEKAYLAVISVIFVVVLFPLFVIVAVIGAFGALMWWLLRQLLRGLDRYVFVIRKDRGL